MNKEPKDYLYLYLPFKIEKMGRIKEVIGIDPRGGKYATFFTTDGFFIQMFEEIKPILLPLGDMTEEKKLKIANMLSGFGHLSDEGKIYQIGELFSNNGYFNKRTNITGSEWNQIINECRKFNIDMDSLIESGLAVNAAELNSVSSR